MLLPIIKITNFKNPRIMNDAQSNKLKMFQAVQTVMDENASIWQDLTIVADVANKVKSIIVDILNIRQVQERDTTGITVNKTVIRDNLVQATLKVIRALVAYATVKKNYVLLGEVNYTKSDLENSRDNILYDRARLIHTKAQSLELELLDYFIGTPDITAIDTLSKEFNIAIPEKRAALTVQKTSTSDLKQKFADADLILKEQLDKVILILEPERPDFVKQYFNARLIIDLGHRTTNHETIISGNILDFVTKQPVTGALVILAGKDLAYTTGSDGHFSLNAGEGGEYIIKVDKEGYQVYTSDPVKVDTGTEVKLEIDLKPELQTVVN